MATASAITALLENRLPGSGSLDEAVSVALRQLDHLRMLIFAIETHMPEINDARGLLYREIEQKLTAKKTNSWTKLEAFICTIVEAACSPVKGLFPREIRQAVREYYDGSFLATLSLLFDLIHGSTPDVAGRALALQQELTGVAQRTGFFAASTRSSSSAASSRGPSVSPSTQKPPSPRKAPNESPRTPTTPARIPSSSSASLSSPRAPSGLAWFIPADSDDDDEQSVARDSDLDEAEAAFRPPSLSRSSSIVPSMSAKQLRSISQLTADSDSLPPWPKPHRSGGDRKSAEPSESHRDDFETAEKEHSSSKLRPAVPSQERRSRSRSGSPSISASPDKDTPGMIDPEFRTPSAKQKSFGLPENQSLLSRRTLNFDHESRSDHGQQTPDVDDSLVRTRTSSTSSVSTDEISSCDDVSSIRSARDESDQIEQQEHREQIAKRSGGGPGAPAEEVEPTTEPKLEDDREESPAERLPDHARLSSRLAMLEEELLNAKGRGVEFSSKLRKAQSTISLLLENGTRTQTLLSELEQESHQLMTEMEQFHDQGDVFFQNFDSIRQDIRKLQQSADQISALNGVLAHTQSELAREKEKNARAQLELAELRDQMQINELTSQFDYMESSARQLESQANIMQMLLQQTRRQLDAVRDSADEVHRIEAEIQDAIREHDEVARSYQQTCQDLSRLRARLVSTTATMVDSATQYELNNDIDC